jgi:hypothetical protein
MSYKNLLMERCRREAESSMEPRVVDYLQHRNDDALRAWRQRQFEYERSRPAVPEQRAS